MSIDLADLETWFSQRPKWLQDAARRLFLDGQLSPNDHNELLILCKREAGISIAECPDIAPRPIPAEAFAAGDTVAALQLDAIAQVTGINALAPRKPLELSRNRCTIVYGFNGSGKSGYIRVLKHICGGRGARPLHRNVFESASPEQGCTVRYTLGTNAKELAWTPASGVQVELRHVAIFDNDCAYVYLNDENEVAYEPALLGHFRTLVEACEAIDAVITAELHQNTSRKPLLPPDFAATSFEQPVQR